MPRLGLGMLSVIYARIKLVIMRFQLTYRTVLGPPIRQDADNTHFLCSEERQNTVVEQICSGDGRPGGMELGDSPFGRGVHKNGADVKGILAAEIAGMVCFDLTICHIVVLFALQGLYLRFSKHDDVFFCGFLFKNS